MRFTHIAAGADGSDEGKDAVALAAGLASLTGAGLSLVNVFPTVLFPSPGTIRNREKRTEIFRISFCEFFWHSSASLPLVSIFHLHQHPHVRA